MPQKADCAGFSFQGVIVTVGLALLLVRTNLAPSCMCFKLRCSLLTDLRCGLLTGQKQAKRECSVRASSKQKGIKRKRNAKYFCSCLQASHVNLRLTVLTAAGSCTAAYRVTATLQHLHCFWAATWFTLLMFRHTTVPKPSLE